MTPERSRKAPVGQDNPILDVPIRKKIFGSILHEGCAYDPSHQPKERIIKADGKGTEYGI
jgi:hypothetical protein